MTDNNELKILALLQEMKVDSDKQFDKIDKQFNKIDKKFDKIDKQFDNIDKKFDKIDKKFDNIDKQFNKINKKFDKIDKKFDNIDKKFDNIDKQFYNIDKKFDKIDKKFGELTPILKAIQKYVYNTGLLGEDAVDAFFDRQNPLIIGDITFDSYKRAVKEKNKFEIDFVLENGKYVGLTEVKRKFLINDVDKFFEKTLPKYKTSRLYSSGKEIIPIFFFKMTSDFDKIKAVIESHMARNKINKYFLYKEIRTEDFEWIK